MEWVGESIKTLLQHYGRELPAEVVLCDEFVIPVSVIEADVPTEWKLSKVHRTNQPKEDVSEQLKKLSTTTHYVPKFEHPGKGLPDHTSGVFILADENPTEESSGEAFLLLPKHHPRLS